MADQVQETDHEFKTAAEMIEWLAEFGRTKSGGVTRLLYSKAWIDAQYALKKWLAQKEFEVRFDEVGNLYGRYSGLEEPESILLTGSHIDTVQEGGKFDGAYGIVASMLAARRLFQKYGRPRKTIEVVSLAEEEGSRFPLTFWGSGWITGRYSLDMAQNIRDTEGISLHKAMQEAGFGKALPRIKHNKPEAFLEIHIEQGITLERKRKAIGIVSHIVGQRRYTVCIKGESNHAGTTPMFMRKDAMKLTADFIVYISKQAELMDKALVATVGKVTAKPNMPNVIAGEVTCSLDVRHYNSAVLDQFEKIVKDFEKEAIRQGMTISVRQWMKTDPVYLNEDLIHTACEQTELLGFPYEKMISGAGHDAQVFGDYCPTGLLFVPSRNGVSHSPEEWTEPEELEKGIQLLMAQLYVLAYE